MEAYKKIQKKHLDDYKDFIEKLDSPVDKEFVKIMDEQLEALPFDFFQMFSDGFKLGAKMMIAALYSENKKEAEE